MSASAVGQRGWIFGPVPDLLLGCGIAYPLVAAGASLAVPDLATRVLWAVPLATVIGIPHYGATLLRVYERREDRRRYTFFAVWATLAVWLTFVVGVYDRVVGSLLVTAYLTWSPWHYTGQNYGLAVMFLRRRGVDVAPATKRWVYASFIASYVLTFLGLQGADPASSYAPAFVPGLGTNYRFMTLAIPVPVVNVLYPAGLAIYAVATAVAWSRLRRVASAAASAPTLVLFATQALWFVVPPTAVWATGMRNSVDHALFFNSWVAIGHALQYVWITTYYAVGTRPVPQRLAYLGRTLLAGAGIWTLPAIVFSPTLLGTISFDLGLYVLVSSAVNVHHFILDGAIWKLRDGPVARILLARPDPAALAMVSPTGAGRRWVLAVCAPLLAINVASLFAHQVLWRGAVDRGDHPLAGRIERALAWLGRDEPAFHQRRAVELQARGDLAGAAASLEQSIALTPTARAWFGLGSLRVRRGDAYGARQSYERSLAIEPTPDAWAGIGYLREVEDDAEGALAAYQAALTLDPNQIAALAGAARQWLARGRPDRARRLLERAGALEPDDPRVRAELAKLSARLADADPFPMSDRSIEPPLR